MAGYERQAEPGADSSEFSDDDDGFEDYLKQLICQTRDQGTDTKIEEEYDKGGEDEDGEMKIEDVLKKEQRTTVEPEDYRRGIYKDS
ncbi:uncharacterized protein DFL_000635 [Arthrobotrys flagrans]|uniref:Uncharacterized protein n=1 Tax=Arthrobotrys flagrans TaxID=97331 RepID=A0A437AEV0_ARTFL|nr:hypothetical protein DFL_000635 [Arthrobotrys flagrans]